VAILGKDCFVRRTPPFSTHDIAPPNLPLIGNDAPGTLVGNDGASGLEGRGGNDQINGYAGNNMLFDGEGVDTLVGGLGEDDFVYLAFSNFRAGVLNRDVITGFNSGAGQQEQIDLSAIIPLFLTGGVIRLLPQICVYVTTHLRD